MPANTQIWPNVSVLDKNEKSQMFGITEGAAVRLTTDPGL